jgi:hypothetical protein
VDGLALGGTPLMVRNIPPGSHLWRVQLPSGDAAGGVVDVASGKSAKVKGEISEGDPESKLLSSLSHNRWDAATLSAAQAIAHEAGASFLVFGTLSREGKDLALDAFLLNADKGSAQRLPRATFDTELLSAGMELYNLAGEIAKKGPAAGEAVPSGEPLAVGHTIAAGRVVDVEYGATLKAPIEGEGTSPEPDKPKSRRPLKR